ncbi:MAG TPA: YdeI/OmpD-associated family protein [Longimicrobium sp.]|nr:YdeI/OmpD-associated family protein [Longimicrobium sp.]
MDATFFDTQDELRRWLEENHAAAAELYVGFYKKGSGKTGITYAQALDEALCFGWIDGVRKRIDDARFTIRFTPRKRGSTWSEVNVKRAGELEAEGRMTPAGLAAFRARDEKKTAAYSYEARERPLDPALEERFRANADAWDFFQAQPPYYRRTAQWFVMSAKREETRLRRLARLIDDSAAGRRLEEVTYKQPKKLDGDAR